MRETRFSTGLPIECPKPDRGKVLRCGIGLQPFSRTGWQPVLRGSQAGSLRCEAKNQPRRRRIQEACDDLRSLEKTV
jgi:hypothetical protein